MKPFLQIAAVLLLAFAILFDPLDVSSGRITPFQIMLVKDEGMSFEAALKTRRVINYLTILPIFIFLGSFFFPKRGIRPRLPFIHNKTIMKKQETLLIASVILAFISTLWTAAMIYKVIDPMDNLYLISGIGLFMGFFSGLLPLAIASVIQHKTWRYVLFGMGGIILIFSALQMYSTLTTFE